VNHTYDSLRELACLALTTPSLEAPAALLVLEDALVEAGVLLQKYQPGCSTPADHQRRILQEWVMRWGMKTVYGASRVDTLTLGIDTGRGFPDTTDHRAWSEERIECRRRGETWRQKRYQRCVKCKTKISDIHVSCSHCARMHGTPRHVT
jgi:hypothetical protein